MAAPLLALALTGCRLVQDTASLPVKAVTGGRAPASDPAALQIELQRFADEYASRTTAVLDDFGRNVGTPEAERQALAWKVAASAAAVSIASGPNPRANLLDFLSLATVTRTALEQGWSRTTNGAAFLPWLETSRALETNAWKLAEGELTPEHQQEMRDAIRTWWESNPGSRTGFFVRPQEFTSLIRNTREKTQRSGSVFSLVGLDPTAGLDPAVREVTRTRLFAERAMFVVQRMPFLVRWQIELMADEILRGTNVAVAVDSAGRLSRAAESFSQTAAQLPDRITAERQAILAALDAQEGKLRELSAEVTRTLAAGEKMSTSLHATITSFDALMKRFGVGEPDTSPPSPPGTNAPPFNILDYARTAEQVSAMARQLDVLIKDAGSTLESPALDKRIAELGTLSDRLRADTKSVLNHAFLLAAALLGLVLAAALIFRRVPRRHETT